MDGSGGKDEAVSCNGGHGDYRIAAIYSCRSPALCNVPCEPCVDGCRDVWHACWSSAGADEGRQQPRRWLHRCPQIRESTHLTQPSSHSGNRCDRAVLVSHCPVRLSVTMSKKPGPPSSNNASGPVRLRQIALVARDLKKTEDLLVRTQRRRPDMRAHSLTPPVPCTRNRSNVRGRSRRAVGTGEHLA